MSERSERKRAAIYLRVSTTDQTTDGQWRELEAEMRRRDWTLASRGPGPLNGELPAIYRETVSGVAKREKRPELELLLQHARRGYFDVVFIWSIDRIGRSALEVLAVAEELYRHDVALVSHREPAVDLTNAMGRLVLEIGAAFAGFERRRLVERTRAGLEAARRKGTHIGRPRVRATAEQVRHLVQLGNRPGRVARMVGCSRATVYRLLARRTSQNG